MESVCACSLIAMMRLGRVVLNHKKQKTLGGLDMKKVVGILVMVMVLFALTACGSSEQAAEPVAEVGTLEAPAEEAQQFVTVTYFDAAGTPQDARVVKSPTSVAIFDWGILDILYTLGWENTGIETLIIPTNALPFEINWFTSQDFVITGGTLHYVNWDILDLVQPELVILGTRSFAHNAAGETTSPEVRAELRTEADEKYPDTAFIRLTQNSTRSNLLEDLEHNVYVLQQIFPQIADELQTYLDASVTALNDLREKVQDSEATALFVMLWEDRMSIFLPDGRFHMVYNEFGFLPAAYDLPEWGDQHGFDARAEFILSVDPDVILLLDRTDMDSPNGGVGVQNFMADSIIQSTTAAQEGHIYVLQGNPWYTLLGGLGALDIMIANIMVFTSTLS